SIFSYIYCYLKPKLHSNISALFFRLAHSHLAELSKKHPFFPKHYIMPWKQDMVNRKLNLKHAGMAGVYTGACEDSLFLENKERLCHGEERKNIRGKVKILTQMQGDKIPSHSPLSRYHSYVISQKTRIRRVA
uniref:Sperm microtubule inner protein 10 n=1 Tax=Leptobrachium leishanense TaxID=445787 RepID=A0A8C5N3W1_9ANUR